MSSPARLFVKVRLLPSMGKEDRLEQGYICPMRLTRGNRFEKYRHTGDEFKSEQYPRPDKKTLAKTPSRAVGTTVGGKAEVVGTLRTHIRVAKGVSGR